MNGFNVFKNNQRTEHRQDMSNTTRIHPTANFVLAVIILTMPAISRAQGLFAQAANSATQVRDAYAEIYNGFYGVGKQKTLFRAALDRRPDGTPNISVDAEAHTADVTIRLFVNDPAYNAWKADAHRRLDALVKRVDFSDFESSHDRVIGGKVYRFGDNEFAAIRKWEQGSDAKQAEIVVRVLFLAKDGKELWRCDLPMERFHRAGGKAARPLYNLNRLNDLPVDRYQMNWGDGFMEGMRKEIKGAALEPRELEDAAAIIHITNMSDSFIENATEIKCIVVDDETLVPERQEAARLARKTIVDEMIPIPGKYYRLGMFEVSQKQWEAVMGKNPSSLRGANHPVENISWEDCQRFLEKLNAFPDVKQSGLTFRLPTAEEWDFACRAGAEGKYCKLSDGTEIEKETLGRVAWFQDGYLPQGKTHPIGQKAPNAFGLYDMHGNVWEWTQTAKSDGSGKYALRGGSWYSSDYLCQVSYNDAWQKPSSSDDECGIRLCAETMDDIEAKRQAHEKAEAERKAREEEERIVQEKEKARAATELAKRLDEMSKTLLDSMVVIPGKDFRVGRCEVTQKQWEAIMGNNPSEHKGDDNPVEMVSWNDCQQFLMKLNALPAAKESGLVFRLPTEEEWEYACRAGATGHYCRLDGTEVTAGALDQVAWFDDNSHGQTHPVGQKKPNAFGLYDMHGNVSEWTSTADGLLRICRGGCFWDLASSCDFSVRHGVPPSDRYGDHGFRLCAEAAAK